MDSKQKLVFAGVLSIFSALGWAIIVLLQLLASAIFKDFGIGLLAGWNSIFGVIYFISGWGLLSGSKRGIEWGANINGFMSGFGVIQILFFGALIQIFFMPLYVAITLLIYSTDDWKKLQEEKKAEKEKKQLEKAKKTAAGEPKAAAEKPEQGERSRRPSTEIVAVLAIISIIVVLIVLISMLLSAPAPKVSPSIKPSGGSSAGPPAAELQSEWFNAIIMATDCDTGYPLRAEVTIMQWVAEDPVTVARREVNGYWVFSLPAKQWYAYSCSAEGYGTFNGTYWPFWMDGENRRSCCLDRALENASAGQAAPAAGGNATLAVWIVDYNTDAPLKSNITFYNLSDSLKETEMGSFTADGNLTVTMPPNTRLFIIAEANGYEGYYGRGDVFSLALGENPSQSVYLRPKFATATLLLSIKDSLTGDFINGAKVQIAEMQSSLPSGYVVTNATVNGFSMFALQPYKAYRVFVSAEGYRGYEDAEDFAIDNSATTLIKELSLSRV
jgi:hypothetical protein